MRALGVVLLGDAEQRPICVAKRDRAINKHDSLFIVKFENLGNNMPLDPLIRRLRNEFKLNGSALGLSIAHSNLQEKLLGDL